MGKVYKSQNINFYVNKLKNKHNEIFILSDR